MMYKIEDRESVPFYTESGIETSGPGRRNRHNCHNRAASSYLQQYPFNDRGGLADQLA